MPPELADYDVASGGPGAVRNTKFNTHSLFVEQQLGPRVFMELAYNHLDLNFEASQPFFNDATQLRGDPNLTLKNGARNDYAGQLLLDGYWFRPRQRREADNYRATITTSFDVGKWGNYRLAAMGEYDFTEQDNRLFAEVWAGRPFNTLPENPANIVYRRNYVVEGDWDSYYIPAPEPIVGTVEPVTGQTLTSTWVNRNQINARLEWQRTLLLGGQARYFGGRLVVGSGLRRGLLKASHFNGAGRDPGTNEYLLSWDPAQAATFKFAGETRTLGIVAHLANRISLLYTGPEIFAWAAEVFPFYEQFPLARINTSEGITAARDLERFRENMDLQKSFDGLGGVGNRRYKVNVFTRYTVSSGRLKGLYFGGGYRHQGKILVGRYTGADGALLWGNSFWQADALLGYQFRRLKWLKQLNLQLNVMNVFDDQRPLITRLYRTVPPTVQRFAPRAWRLTANFDF